VTIDVAPTSLNNRTIVPLRFITETLGLKVDWDAETETVEISDEVDDTATDTTTDTATDTTTDATTDATTDTNN
jgi:hypothetical protein